MMFLTSRNNLRARTHKRKSTVFFLNLRLENDRFISLRFLFWLSLHTGLFGRKVICHRLSQMEVLLTLSKRNYIICAPLLK